MTDDEGKAMHEAWLSFQDGKPPQKYILTVTQSGPTVGGYFDADDQLWHHQIEHEDGRIERFVSRTFPGDLFEDNP